MSWHKIHLDEIDSTSDEAKRLIKKGQAQDRQYIIANQQTNGHGRYGRKWQSMSGNLHVSLILQIPDDLKQVSQYTFITAVALGEVLQQYIQDTNAINYKWPNDILVSSKKISGILLETLKSPNGDNWLVIGLGVNIKSSPDITDKPTIFLNDCTQMPVEVEQLFNKFIQTFETQEKLWQIDGFSCIRKAWLDRAYKLDEIIQVNIANQVISGRFAGLSRDGELELEQDGKIRLISSGEVFFSAITN